MRIRGDGYCETARGRHGQTTTGTNASEPFITTSTAEGIALVGNKWLRAPKIPGPFRPLAVSPARRIDIAVWPSRCIDLPLSQ
jgi:hypothetical protein